MRNKLSDLNNHLFAQIERLGEEDLTSEQIQVEVRRSQAVCAVAEEIVKTAALQLSAVKLIAEYGDKLRPSLPMIEGSNNGQG